MKVKGPTFKKRSEFQDGHSGAVGQAQVPLSPEPHGMAPLTHL